MSDIALDFTGLYVALGIGVAAAFLVAPLAWFRLHQLAVIHRVLFTLLLTAFAAGLAGVVADAVLHDGEIAEFSLATALLLQVLVLPILLFLSRKGR